MDDRTLVSRQLVHSNTGVLTAAFSPDSEIIAQLRRTGVTVWNTTTGADICRIAKKEKENIEWTAVAISGDKTAVVVSKPDGQQAYDLTTGTPGVMSAWPKQSFNNSLMKASPDGRWLVAASDLGTAFWPADHLLGPSTRQPAWLLETQGRSADLVFSEGGSLVASARGYTGWTVEGQPAATVIEIGHAQPLCTLPLTRGKIDLIRFVPHRPLLVSASRDGVAVVWDFHLLLDVSQDGHKTDQALFDDLQSDSPVTAYRAGLLLLDRKKLAPFASKCKPLLITLAGRADSAQIPALVKQLSSPNTADREKAHKKLEGFGPAAIDAIQRALASHPGGELEERLNDIAHVIGADDAVPVANQSSDDGNSLADDAEQPLGRRMIQLLDWSTDPTDQAQRLRLIGTSQASTTEPSR